MLERADADDDAVEIDVGRFLLQRCIRGYLRQPLENIDLPKVGCDQGPVAASQTSASVSRTSSCRSRSESDVNSSARFR
jgi:hypothetical protein